MRTIEYETVTETIFSDRYPFVGCFVGETEFPYVYYNRPQRNLALLMAKSGLKYKPRVRPEDPSSRDKHLVLIGLDTGARAILNTDSVAEFMAALELMGEMR
jgi:hypothetical protein